MYVPSHSLGCGCLLKEVVDSLKLVRAGLILNSFMHIEPIIV
jgi:hypothetical protein